MISLPSLILLAVMLVLYLAFRRLWIQPTGRERLERIQLVARIFKWVSLAAFGFVLFMVASAVAFPDAVLPLNPPLETEATISRVASPGTVLPAGNQNAAHIGIISIRSPLCLSNFKPEVSWLYFVFWGFFGTLIWRAIWLFYRLFSNLEKGILFGSENVTCIRRLGWLIVAIPFLEIGFQLSKMVWSVGDVMNIDLSSLPNNLFQGFFIIFVAWIMDEGRKIQEEQELTV